MEAAHRAAGQPADHEPGGHPPGHHAQKQTLIATERDEVARAQWRQRVQPTRDPATTVFVDETGTNTAMTRRYGRAPRGQRVVDRAPRNHDPNVTLLAALGPHGIVASVAVPGAMDRAVLTTFLHQELLPQLAPGTSIVWDNLSVHSGDAIGDQIAAAGCTRVFLPTYSPDLNPIETVFSVVKEALRGAKARDPDTLMTAMGTALNGITPAMAHRMIHHGGYRPPSQPL